MSLCVPLLRFNSHLTKHQAKLDKLYIPLHVFTNIEYEVDELRRDIATVKYGREKGVDVVCVHDRLCVPPGRVKSLQGKPMSVFRWVHPSECRLAVLTICKVHGKEVRRWTDCLDGTLTGRAAWAKLIEKEASLLDMSPLPDSNDPSIRQHEHVGKLFNTSTIPDHVEGFECKDAEKMVELYPEGTEVAKEVRTENSLYWNS